MLGPHEKALEFKLRQFISSIVLRTLNPRSLVQVVIQVLSVDPASFNSVVSSLFFWLIVDQHDSYNRNKCGNVGSPVHPFNSPPNNNICD